MTTIAQRDLPSRVRFAPEGSIDTYGAMSYTDSGYFTGHLPDRLRTIYRRINGGGYTPTIYSYGTPIAWYDREHGVWVKPDVSYSITTSKHQSYLHGGWRSTGLGDIITIPADCGLDEYLRYVSGQMTYSRWDGIKPGPNFVLA